MSCELQAGSKEAYQIFNNQCSIFNHQRLQLKARSSLLEAHYSYLYSTLPTNCCCLLNNSSFSFSPLLLYVYFQTR